MKKIALVVAVTFMAGSALAQNTSPIGVKAGLNVATQSDSDGPRNGVYFGLFCEARLAGIVDFQPELLYAMQGSKYTLPGAANSTTDKVDYIYLPLMFKFHVDGARRFSIDAGPQFGYMISAKRSTPSNEEVFYGDEGTNKFDAGLNFGLSYETGFGFDVSARYSRGLTDVLEHETGKNSAFQIGLGYRF